MQLTNILTILALTVVGAVAAPGGGGHQPPAPPPKPAPPVINHQVVRLLSILPNHVLTYNTYLLLLPSQNYCSSGAPYCCSPANENGQDGNGGTTCVLSTTQCNSVSICCNNAQNGGGSAVSTYFLNYHTLNHPPCINHWHAPTPTRASSAALPQALQISLHCRLKQRRRLRRLHPLQQ
jgi:hypothetical protein